MEALQTLGVILVGGLVLYFFLPGTREQLRLSQQATNKDWVGFLVPIGVVVVFVVLLIALAR